MTPEGDRDVDGNRLTHIGLCVSDIERSRAFYCDVLGFAEVARRLVVTDEDSTRLMGLGAMNLELLYVQRDGIRIELLCFRSPGYHGDRSPRPMNLLGLTHFALRVGDFDGLCRRITAGGGVVLADSVATFAQGNRGIMALDPDGIRVELIERPTA
jgi:glyoxylase I family protein